MSCFFCAAHADAVLVESSRVKVTGMDLEARLQRIPEENRAEVLGSKARIAKLLEDLLVNRALAQQARDAGLDKTPLYRKQMELLEDSQLSKEWLDKQVDALKLPSFEARARELYRLDEKKYEIPAQVHASHILVDTKSRSKEEALARAKEIREKLSKGASFEVVAEEFSDDPSAKKNKGDLGFFEAARMVKPFSNAAFAMSKPGEISEPVLTQFGYHVIKLHELKPSRLKPFEEVKGEIVDNLRNQYRQEYRQNLINKAKTDPSLKLHEEEINKFYVDLEAIQKQSAGAGK
ncbi:MAG: peptidylprolyl isomerase [Sulfuricella sp.]